MNLWARKFLEIGAVPFHGVGASGAINQSAVINSGLRGGADDSPCMDSINALDCAIITDSSVKRTLLKMMQATR